MNSWTLSSSIDLTKWNNISIRIMETHIILNMIQYVKLL